MTTPRDDVPDLEKSQDPTDDPLVALLHEGRFEELAIAMARGAEIGRIRATRRVQREALGKRLYAWVDLLEADLRVNLARQTVRAETEGTVWSHAAPDFPVEGQETDAYAWRPAVGSPAEADVASWLAAGWPQAILQPSHKQDHGPAMDLARRVVEAAVDQLRGMALLLTDEKITRPPLASARIVLDATAHVYSIFEPDLDPDERLRRVLNEVLARLGEKYFDALRGDDSAAEAEAGAEVDEIFRAVGDRETCLWKRDRFGQAPFVGRKPLSTGKLVDELLSGSTSWHELSGVVHNREDEGSRIMLGQGSIDNPHKGMYVALYAFPAVVGIAMLVDRVEDYTGWDLGTTRAAVPDLLAAWADASGMNDKLHNAAIEAELDAASRRVSARPPRTPQDRRKPKARTKRRGKGAKGR